MFCSPGVSLNYWFPAIMSLLIFRVAVCWWKILLLAPGWPGQCCWLPASPPSPFAVLYILLCAVSERTRMNYANWKYSGLNKGKDLLNSCELQMKRKMCLALSPCGLHSDKARALVPYSYFSQSWHFAAAGKQKVHSCPVVVLCLLFWLTLLTCSKHIILPSQN